jgi:ankyrin repeat protein
MHWFARKQNERARLPTALHWLRKQARDVLFTVVWQRQFDALCFPLLSDNVDEILSGIANKIDVDANGSDGRNALHWACTLHRTSICHVLLKKGASISKKDVRVAASLPRSKTSGE